MVTSSVLKGPASADSPVGPSMEVAETVSAIIADVRTRGDVAVREQSKRLDGWSPTSFRLDPAEIERIVGSVPKDVLRDLEFAQAQVRGFAELQRASLTDFEAETLPGVFLGQRHIPVSSAGSYVPGGRFALTASAHMTIVTAKVAGVRRIIACTPPLNGQIPVVTVAAMYLAGADEIYLLGGVQALAAMAFGTESIPRTDFLSGPGNAYVAEAKRQLFGHVGIDLCAGPTEILVIADDKADPFVVAVDLLSQAEHGPDSPAILVTPSEWLARSVLQHIDALLPGMPTRDYAEVAWRNYGQVHVVEDLKAAYSLADQFAAEHVEVLTREPREALASLTNYGALFLGEGTCVSYGDKVIGTNHVLPTLGGARYTGGLWVGKYLKTVTYQEIVRTEASAMLGEVCGRAARVEGFEGHARSGDIRMAKYAGAELPWTAEPAVPREGTST